MLKLCVLCAFDNVDSALSVQYVGCGLSLHAGYLKLSIVLSQNYNASMEITGCKFPLQSSMTLPLYYITNRADEIAMMSL